MMRIAVCVLALAAFSAIDSSKATTKKGADCFLGLFCTEDEDEYEKRMEETGEHMKKVDALKKQIAGLQEEKDAREQAAEEAHKRKIGGAGDQQEVLRMQFRMWSRR